ncbi:MAG: TspO/MBR family protein [Pseudolabrys sp.]|nr:TspO/MBR family protein [Pseudolabrys sp.]
MTASPSPAWRRDLGLGAVAVAAVAATLLCGQLATSPNSAWYSGLTKPSFGPPSWLFAPVWTTLYVLMAFALWRILRLPPSPLRRTALLLFFIQLGLNAAWPWMFFAAQNPFLGLVNIVPQFLFILATIAAFARLDRYAMAALVPLAAWVGFASVLNAAFWWLNP